MDYGKLPFFGIVLGGTVLSGGQLALVAVGALVVIAAAIRFAFRPRKAAHQA